MSETEELEGAEEEVSHSDAESQELAAVCLVKAASGLADALNQDLAALLGCEVSASAGDPTTGGGSDLPFSGGLCVQQTRCEDGDFEELQLVFEESDAAMLGAIKAGCDVEAAKTARESGYLDEHEEAFAEVNRLVSALLVSGFGTLEAGTLSLGESGIHSEEEPPGFLGGTCSAIPIRLELEGHEPATLHLVVAVDGANDAPVLILVEPDPDERERLEERAEALERDVSAVSAAELDEDVYDAMADADGIVVAWDLAGRSGLELIEHLSREPRTRDKVLVMSHVQPSRVEVELALRAGAHSLVLRPYEIEELDEAIRRVGR